MIGSLSHIDYLTLCKEDQILSKKFSMDQIQPSSLDLTLSNECYQIEHSFLSPTTTVREKLKILQLKKLI